MSKALSTEEQAALDADLIAAIKASDTESAITALEQGANPNTCVEIPWWGCDLRPTPALILALTWRCHRNVRDFDITEAPNYAIVRALVERGARLCRDTPYGASPLYEVAGLSSPVPGRLELAAFLLDQGAQVDEKVHYYQTPLYAACTYGDVEMIHLLLDRGADINAHSYSGPTLLMGAVHSRDKEVVAALIARGADVHFRNWDGETALTRAQGKSKVIREIREMLEAAGAKLDLVEVECRQLLKMVEKAEDPDAKTVERWQELWHANLEGDKFHNAPVLHAYLLSRLGWELAAIREDYPAAIDFMNHLMSHPEACKLHVTDHRDLYQDKLWCLFQSGAENQAILLARQLMTGEVDGCTLAEWPVFPPDDEENNSEAEEKARKTAVWQAKQLVRDTLKDYFKTIEDQRTPLSAELATLAWDISQETRHDPLTRRRLPEQATPKALVALLSRRRRPSLESLVGRDS